MSISRDFQFAANLVRTESDYVVGESSIHGRGVIAAREFRNGELIGAAVTRLINGGVGGMERTELGRFANHQEKPNAKLERVGGDVYALRATEDISSSSEITMSYWDTPAFVAKPSDIDPKFRSRWK